MTTFTRNWTDAYEGLPPNSEDARKGASRIRELKADLHERLEVDHSWAGDAKDGMHSQITFLEQSTDLATVPNGRLYAKLVGTDVELVFKSKNGVVTQLTSTGSPANSYILPGTIIAVGNALVDMSPAYFTCDGSAISRTTYAALFTAIGILWGPGDGLTTFNVPDLRGRTLIGAGAGTGLTNRAVAAFLGEERHVLTVPEIPAHTHPTIANTSGAGGVGSIAYKLSNTAETTAGTDPSGGGTSHENMQPSVGVHYVIKS